MSELIYIHRYQLRSRQPLNQVSERTEFTGALIRVGDGFGCIHPWSELGDQPLDAQLDRLAKGETTPLLEQTLECCRIDGEFRSKGQSAFEGLQIPPSHYTMPAWEKEVPVGFSRVKIKCGPDGKATSKRLAELGEGYQFRLDFNSSLLSARDFRLQWMAIDEALRERVELVEDPLAFHEEEWRDLKSEFPEVLWAVDRSEAISEVPDVRVIKPAVQGAEWTRKAVASAQGVLFTSYMDHPLGQMWAAWRAATQATDFAEQLLDCGLVTHHLFDPENPFVAELGKAEPVLRPPKGTGLGFDDLLEGLPWEQLKTNS